MHWPRSSWLRWLEKSQEYRDDLEGRRGILHFASTMLERFILPRVLMWSGFWGINHLKTKLRKGAKYYTVTNLGITQARPADGTWHERALHILSSWLRRNCNSNEFDKMLNIILNKRMGDRFRSTHNTSFIFMMALNIQSYILFYN